jgi:hypothetical protein
VKVDGTLNKRGDTDTGWSVEIALPLADVNGLETAGVKLPPALGDSWRINMFRLDAPEGKAQQASAWSPPLVGDFHALDKFGELVFADDKGQVPAPVQAVAPTPTKPFDHKTALKESLNGLGAGTPGADHGLDKKPAAKRKKAVEVK